MLVPFLNTYASVWALSMVWSRGATAEPESLPDDEPAWTGSYVHHRTNRDIVIVGGSVFNWCGILRRTCCRCGFGEEPRCRSFAHRTRPSVGGHLRAVSDKRDSAAGMCFTTTQHYFPRVLWSAASTLHARARRRMAKLRVLQDRWRSRGYAPIICYHVVAVSAIMTLRDCELHPLIRSFLMTFLLKRCLANVSL